MEHEVTQVLATIAANVRRARRRRDWTQEKLAQEADQDLSYVQRVERGVTNVSVAVLVALSSALEVPLTALFRKTNALERPTGRPRKRRA